MGLTTAVRKLRYPVNTDAFNPPLHIKQLAEDVDALLGESVPTAASLPMVDNWPNRSILVEDEDTVYVWIDAAWVPVYNDTGWVVLTPESAFYNITVFGDDRALSARRIGKVVRVEGHIGTDGATASGSIWALLTAPFRPAKNAWLLASPDGTGSGTNRCFVNSLGQLKFVTPATGAQEFIVSGTYFVE